MTALSPARLFALVGGVLYLIIGIAGFFVTGFADVVGPGDSLLGFSVNPFHNFVHVGIGVLLLLASQVPVPGVAEGILIGGGLVLLLAAFLGFTGNLDLLAIESANDPDNYLHLVTGVVAIAFGLTGTAGAARAA